MFPDEQSLITASAAANTQKPKRPRSAYNIFFNEERSRIIIDAMRKGEMSLKEASRILSTDIKRYRRKHGRIGRSEITKMIAAKWKNFSSRDKLSYEIAAEKDMERCREELKIWTELQQKLPIHKSGSFKSTSANNTIAVIGSSSQEIMDHQDEINVSDASRAFVAHTQKQQEYQRMTPNSSRESMALFDSLTSLLSKDNCFSNENADAVLNPCVLEAICKNASPKLAQLNILQNVPNLFTVKSDGSNDDATTSYDTGVIIERQVPISEENNNQDAKKLSLRQRESTTSTTLYQRSVDILAAQLNEETTEFIIASFSTNK